MSGAFKTSKQRHLKGGKTEDNIWHEILDMERIHSTIRMLDVNMVIFTKIIILLRKEL